MLSSLDRCASAWLDGDFAVSVTASTASHNHGIHEILGKAKLTWDFSVIGSCLPITNRSSSTPGWPFDSVAVPSRQASAVSLGVRFAYGPTALRLLRLFAANRPPTRLGTALGSGPVRPDLRVEDTRPRRRDPQQRMPSIRSTERRTRRPVRDGGCGDEQFCL